MPKRKRERENVQYERDLACVGTVCIFMFREARKHNARRPSNVKRFIRLRIKMYNMFLITSIQLLAVSWPYCFESQHGNRLCGNQYALLPPPRAHFSLLILWWTNYFSPFYALVDKFIYKRKTISLTIHRNEQASFARYDSAATSKFMAESSNVKTSPSDKVAGHQLVR